jgi:hypothetical protein
LYKELEDNYLTSKIFSLQNAAPNSEEEKQRRIYEKTKMFINLKTKQQIADLKDKLKAGNLSVNEQRQIKRAINDAEVALKTVGGRQNFVSNVGQWEGYLNSIKMLGGPLGTNVVGSILSGDYFDPRKNSFAPVQSIGFKEIPGVEIYAAKIDRKIVKKENYEMLE